MSTLDFYDSITPVRSFDQVFDQDYYRPVPGEWFVAVTDVVNSTRAILQGQYKHVNVSGTLGAMALANIRHDFEFPFLFGGDGMVLVLPPDLEQVARSVLADVRNRVRDSFGLDLRVGIVPVSDLYDRGAELRIGKLHVSEHYKQALFSGNGVEQAEFLVKQEADAGRYLIPKDYPVETPADLDGFSCRWQDIPSSKGEIVSLIVRLLGDETRQNRALQRTLDLLARVLGDDREYHPLTVESMRMNRSKAAVSIEARVGSAGGGAFRTFLRALRIRIEMFATSIIIALNLPLKRGVKPLNRVREANVINSDFRKFDGTLKMVVATSGSQREIMDRLLSDMRRRGTLQYGLHVSDRAVLTCLIHFQSGGEVHFVDGADGGYALAAQQLKQQIAEQGG